MQLQKQNKRAVRRSQGKTLFIHNIQDFNPALPRGLELASFTTLGIHNDKACYVVQPKGAQ